MLPGRVPQRSGFSVHGSGREDAQSRKKRRAFTKLIKDKHATVSSVHQARRFVEGMETFVSKVELLSKLDDTRDMGMQRIQDVLCWVNSSHDVEMLLVPMLQQVMNEETARPLYRPLRDKVLMAIFSVPGLMDALVRYEVVSTVERESAEALSLFLLAVAKAFVEVRTSDPVTELARLLRARGDITDASVLCAILLVDEEPRVQSEVESIPSSKGSAACWVTDTVPPGGRHDNDHRNYRNIKIVPTVDELRCSSKSWLPLASGENDVIEDAGIRLLDRNFRLLREDAVNTMKVNIAEQVRPWRNARIVGLDFGGKGMKALSFVVQCDSRSGQNPNWKRSRALMHGTVVAFCRDGIPARLGTISVREADVKGEWLDAPGGPKFGVVFDSQSDFEKSLDEMLRNSSLNESLCELKVEAHLETGRIESLMRQLVTFDLIEASKSFFTYQPILRTLQKMEGVPLMDEIVGLTTSTTCRLSYLPERVVLPPDDHFRGYAGNFNTWTSADLTENTSLDSSQAEALIHAFKSKVSLIQGPPGCGKTFIGALIARVIRGNTDESILCVCYTNHALDQFLEHMLEAGETRVVRMGGRSKSERVGRYQLRELARQKSKLETNDSRRLKQVDAQLYKQRDVIDECIKAVKSPVKWNSPCGGVREFLSSDFPDIFGFLRVPELGDGFELLGSNGKKIRDDFLWNCWRKGEEFPLWIVPYISNEMSPEFQAFWSRSRDDRVTIIENWRRDLLQVEMDRLHDAVARFNVLKEEKKAILEEKELQVLRDARVIGATTTGAAQFRELLSAKGSGVVIVEEAGEVLEAHVLTALAESTRYSQPTKHVVLIGDHKQLRPKVENYQLTTVSRGGYNLDCSLFERLVLSNLPSVALEVQHRMRPAISRIVRSQTYKSLLDHESVNHYPDVKGVTNNVVFIDHKVPEDGEQHDDDQYGNAKTKTNLYEAELCVEMVRYFLLQGYAPSQIVVLTPYLGQLVEILRLVKSSLKEVVAYVSDHDQRDLENFDTTQDPGVENSATYTSGGNSVRCSSIDNFQGEEADIIIISLVRSNKRGNIGFLKEEQRVNVLLSRARYGMFVVGNSKTLCQSSSGGHVWEPILSMMKDSGELLDGLPTCCQLHPDDGAVQLCKPVDFRTVRPNGGCGRSCTFRMDCGHVCPKSCHPIDRSHSMAQRECCEPCRRFPPECTRGHFCPKLCKEDCGPCNARVGPITLTCGHAADSVRCHDVRTQEEVEHFSKRCKTRIHHKFVACGHEEETTCGNARSTNPICPAICGATASCGHPCTNKCGGCDQGHDCKQKCDRVLFCNHLCGRPCHGQNPCEPCEKKCSVKCVHSACPKACNAPCASCVEPCDWVCEHEGQCPLVCGAPCTRLPCDKRCSELLPCGHQCPSVCGELCPPERFCQECAPPDVKSHVVDMISFESYSEHDVNADPIVCLPCGHLYSVSTLDGHLGFSEVYAQDKESMNWTGVKSLRLANINEKPKLCPDCRSGIHSIQRYGRLLRLVELRGLERKHLMAIDRVLDLLSGSNAKDVIRKLEKLLKQIEASPMRQVYEACGGCEDIEVSPPPPRPLIRALELLGNAYADKVQATNDENYELSKKAYERAISVALASTSVRSGASLRITLAAFMMKWNIRTRSLQNQVFELLDWVIENATLFTELVAKAEELKQTFGRREEIAKVVAAMNQVSGYNYGGSWTSHWFECPNGHPFFIGECGGAMQTARCIECGEAVGGSSHTLLRTNRRADQFLRDIQEGG